MFKKKKTFTFLLTQTPPFSASVLSIQIIKISFKNVPKR